MTSSGRILKILLGITISGALLIYLLWNADLKTVAARLADTHWGFLTLCTLLNFSTYWMRAWRWRYLFPPKSQPSRLLNAVFIGYMANNLLPLRAGEVLRAYVVTRHGQSFWITIATLLVERVLDGLAVGLMLASIFLLMPVPRELQWAALLFLSADLTAMVILAIITLFPHGCRALIPKLVRGAWLRDRLLKVFETVNQGLEGLRTPSHLLPIIIWSVVIWVTLAFSVWTGFLAARLDLPFSASWAVIAFLGLGVSLPSSPGFVGVFQAATVLALGLFAVPSADALSFSLLIHASQFIPVTVCGLLLLAVEQVRLSDATRISQAPAAPSPS